jgi:hypothetical protein
LFIDPEKYRLCVYSRDVLLSTAASRLLHTIATLTMLAALLCTAEPCLALPPPTLLMDLLEYFMKIIPATATEHAKIVSSIMLTVIKCNIEILFAKQRKGSFIHFFFHQWLYSPLLGPGLFFSFVIFLTQMIGLLGRVLSPSQGRYLHTKQHKHRINA